MFVNWVCSVAVLFLPRYYGSYYLCFISLVGLRVFILCLVLISHCHLDIIFKPLSQDREPSFLKWKSKENYPFYPSLPYGFGRIKIREELKASSCWNMKNISLSKYTWKNNLIKTVNSSIILPSVNSARYYFNNKH